MYESFVAERYNITKNGRRVAKINNADILTYYLTYKAYKSVQQATEHSPLTLPGLKFTPEQFFWISSAQRFCILERNDEITKRKILTDFPADQFRVNNPLRNNNDFAKDFECQEGSPMNIIEKC